MVVDEPSIVSILLVTVSLGLLLRRFRLAIRNASTFRGIVWSCTIETATLWLETPCLFQVNWEKCSQTDYSLLNHSKRTHEVPFCCWAWNTRVGFSLFLNVSSDLKLSTGFHCIQRRRALVNWLKSRFSSQDNCDQDLLWCTAISLRSMTSFCRLDYSGLQYPVLVRCMTVFHKIP